MEFFQKKLELADESLALLLREPVFIALEVEEASGRHHAEKRVQLKRFQSKLKSLEEEKKYWMDAIQSATKDLSQSTNHQVADPCPPSHQDDLTAALSCLKFLDAIAVKLTEFYDFELKDPSYISLGGILDAIDNWKWDFRFKLGERVTSKSPHHIFSEDEKRSQELWNVLRALNSKTMRRIHDRCLLKTGNGNALLAISRTEYSLDRVQDLKDIGLAMGLVDDKDDLTVVCSPSEMIANNGALPLDAVENKFRAHIFAMRIRLVDLFAHFDKLRSGFITASQFRRCIGAAYDKGVVTPLTQAECDILVSHYDVKKNGMVKWRAFADSIDKDMYQRSLLYSSAHRTIVFGATKLEQTPTKYIPEVVQLKPTMSPKSESVLSEVIERLRSYVKHHGSDVKYWFKDFDKYNNGYVTYNQFRRGIPQNLLSMEEEDILLARYGEPITGTVNYFKMNTEVNRKTPRPKVDVAQLVAKLKVDTDYEHEHVPVGTEELLHGNTASHSIGKRDLPAIEEKIKRCVYKSRIRLLEFFRDYDRHNHGLVSEFQFIAGLHRSSLPLEDAEMKILVSAYQKDGRLQYRKFCSSIDKVFTINHLESNPLAEVKPPSREWLVQGTNELSAVEEARLSEIITRLRSLIAERRLLLLPFFKDFDRFLGNLGRVTRSHFSRLLSTMKIDILDDDLHILFKKYEDRGQSKVNYMEFIRTIDPDTYDHTRQRLGWNTVPSSNTDAIASGAPIQATSIPTILTRIQTHAGTKRIRVSEFFRDFDRLRSYSIPRQEFTRGVDMIECPLTPAEFEALADYYQDPNRKGFCKWKEFEIEIEKVFVDANLEARPSHVPSPIKVQKNPYMTVGILTESEQLLLQKTLDNIREHLRIRQFTVKPLFKDFDKVCTGTGHVTRAQFRQCLTYMKVDVTDAEFDVLCKRWTKDEMSSVPQISQGKKDYIQTCSESICYLMFLQELENGMAPEMRESAEASEQVIPSVKALPDRGTRAAKSLTPEEFQQLMSYIKAKVKRERIRVIDFLADFDHMRHGQITENEFRRGVKIVFAKLNEPELSALARTYQSKKDPRMVDFVAFSDEIESVFTVKGLQTNPTYEMTEYIPDDMDPTLNILSAKDQAAYQQIIDGMVEKVRQRRIDPLTYLEDFDFIKEGTITTNQFRSVLNEVGLAVNDEEIKVLAHRFATTKALDRVNYRSFAAALSQSAGDDSEDFVF